VVWSFKFPTHADILCTGELAEDCLSSEDGLAADLLCPHTDNFADCPVAESDVSFELSCRQAGGWADFLAESLPAQVEDEGSVCYGDGSWEEF
jgi:hypothetical protein